MALKVITIYSFIRSYFVQNDWEFQKVFCDSSLINIKVCGMKYRVQQENWCDWCMRRSYNIIIYCIYEWLSATNINVFHSTRIILVLPFLSVAQLRRKYSYTIVNRKASQLINDDDKMWMKQWNILRTMAVYIMILPAGILLRRMIYCASVDDYSTEFAK